MENNTIDVRQLQEFKDDRFKFSVSSRNLQPGMDIITYLKLTYIYCNLEQIENVFGNTDFYSGLYGGYAFNLRYALTDEHVYQLNGRGIALALTLTNHFFDAKSYKESKSLLKKHHKKGNTIICTNDTLALQLRDDFPEYHLRASVIKNLNTLDKVCHALTIYDSVVIPMDKNDDDCFIRDIPNKERIILFGNANCGYTCPEKSCYLGLSQRNAGKPVQAACSRGRLPRLEQGTVFFNVKKFAEMGYSHFKLVPAKWK